MSRVGHPDRQAIADDSLEDRQKGKEEHLDAFPPHLATHSHSCFHCAHANNQTPHPATPSVCALNKNLTTA